MSKKKNGLSRRQFLVGAAGISVVAIGGTGIWAVRQPELSFIENSYSGDGNQRVLVAYASQYGSTGGIADAIAQALNEGGATADVHRITETLDATGYDAAIIGAPVISSEWMPDAADFVARNRNALSSIPTATFLTCMELALNPNVEESQAKMVAVLEKAVASHIQPVEYGLFAGAVDYSKMAPAMQMLYRLFSEDDTEGDFRDFSAVRAWADMIAPRLLV